MLWICSTAVPAKAQLSFVVIGANFTPESVDLQQQGTSSMPLIARENDPLLFSCLAAGVRVVSRELSVFLCRWRYRKRLHVMA